MVWCACRRSGGAGGLGWHRLQVPGRDAAVQPPGERRRADTDRPHTAAGCGVTEARGTRAAWQKARDRRCQWRSSALPAAVGVEKKYMAALCLQRLPDGGPKLRGTAPHATPQIPPPGGGSSITGIRALAALRLPSPPPAHPLVPEGARGRSLLVVIVPLARVPVLHLLGSVITWQMEAVSGPGCGDTGKGEG